MSTVTLAGHFGATTAGEAVHRYTLKNENNVSVDIITYGGVITSIQVPDKNGKLADITTGFDNVADYETKSPYFGALVGRVANRIHKGEFTLDGETYKLVVNNGPNHLHGGTVGFSKKVWEASIEGDKLKLCLTSPDMDEGYPGEVKVTATYQLNQDNELVIDYTATSTKATPINLTNHAYFNLAGHEAPDVYDHLVTVFAEKFTPKNEDGVPSGEIASVAGTLYDLRQPVAIGERVHSLTADKGYDMNFCVDGTGHKKLAARVEHEASGRVLEVYTDQPGVQLYTGNFLPGATGKGGAIYKQHSSFCLETQNYPDAINKPDFPSCVLRPGQTYRHTCWYKFITKK